MFIYLGDRFGDGRTEEKKDGTREGRTEGRKTSNAFS